MFDTGDNAKKSFSRVTDFNLNAYLDFNNTNNLHLINLQATKQRQGRELRSNSIDLFNIIDQTFRCIQNFVLGRIRTRYACSLHLRTLRRRRNVKTHDTTTNIPRHRLDSTSREWTEILRSSVCGCVGACVRVSVCVRARIVTSLHLHYTISSSHDYQMSLATYTLRITFITIRSVSTEYYKHGVKMVDDSRLIDI
jgi:hypothetical protein